MLKGLFAKPRERQVNLSPSGDSFAVGRNQTVLEAALAQGLRYPHDCTVGTCGSCRSRLKSGKVDAITPFGYTLSREELEAGYILACQAIPKSDLEIEVEFECEHLEARTTSSSLLSTKDLTHDIKLVTWRVETPITYRAGQYMKVSWPGCPGPRCYSFSKAPGVGGDLVVSTFVRRVPGGAFSELIFDGDATSVEFTIEAPHGGFWLRDGDGPILLVGGGSGLSPLISVLEDAARSGVTRDAFLLFGGRAERDLYCLEEIEAIAAAWHGSFNFRPVLSEQDTGRHRTGFVTDEIAAAIAELGGASSLQAYLCGPPGMIDAGVATLAAHGVQMADIHYDKFTDASTLSA